MRPAARLCSMVAHTVLAAHRIGNGKPGIVTRSSMQEILPRGCPLPPISPAVLGELSRRLPSEFAVQNLWPTSTGLVGVSRGPVLRNLVVGSGGFRKTSIAVGTGPPR